MSEKGNTAVAVLWKAQLWEFAAEWNEDETQLLALNIHRDAGVKKGYVGMSELSVNRYPYVFPPIEQFFRRGLLISKEIKLGITLKNLRLFPWKAGISWHDG